MTHETAKDAKAANANPPRIPFLYTLTKIHKPTPVVRPKISGNDTPSEQISAFMDSILQPIAKSQKFYLKDTVDLINFIEITPLPEGIFCFPIRYQSLHEYSTGGGDRHYMQSMRVSMGTAPPIPTHSLKEILRLILQENSFEFNGRNYLQIHRTAPLCQRSRQK